MSIKISAVATAAICLCLCRFAFGTQADDTTITITGNTPGSSPFISQVNLIASDTSVIKSIKFTIAPKPGSVTRPLSATYSNAYLTDRGDMPPGTEQIFLPIYGLYSDYSNTVTLTYNFLDGSSKTDTVTISTGVFINPCPYGRPTVLQPRTNTTDLSYDYILIKGACTNFSPAIIDTDGTLRWMAPVATLSAYPADFFDNAVFYLNGTQLYHIDLDGTVTPLADYSTYGDLGITIFHHNIDRGKQGLILQADTQTYRECVILEVDSSGNVLKTWNMADIITAAMIAGGDDPSQFVYKQPTDWFHSNSVSYNRADDSLIVSSRENFLIDIDYDTGQIKWILGDPTKHWHDFSSLVQYALDVPPDAGVPPIGQHAISVTYNQEIMVLDNGLESMFQQPAGDSRDFASPRRYRLDLTNKTATQVWNYEMDQSIYSPICSSVYEDAPFNYLIDYADINGFTAQVQYAQLLGLDPAGEKVFYFQYPTTQCSTAFSSVPLHLESTAYPTVGPQMVNLSTRGLVGTDETALIGGFIVTGSDSHTLVLRALGPSLASSGLTQTVADPSLTLHNASGATIATNDDWQSDPGASQIEADGLAPGDPAESATMQTLAPGAYTFVVTGKDITPGVGLVEAYDLSPLANSKVANLSTRGSVGTGDNVLIGGFIVGDVASDSIIIRALGPSLASSGVTAPLADPTLTVFDANGLAIATNDNWQDDLSASGIMQHGLAPTNALEAATLLHLPAGAYTTIVTGGNGGSGIGLVEFFDLDASTD
ncbi:MAG TPA: aryl-sulfate sulfotransferase [Candidatus Binataceae bacterium]|nr:aryl-sulfate sulfotransferase [Candidatus Binataceae bacterium]